MTIFLVMKIQTQKVLEHMRSDIVVFGKDTRSCKIVDMMCPFDARVVEEKMAKYRDLKYESKRIWYCSEVTVIPAVIGALGKTSKDFRKWTKRIDPNVCMRTLRKAFILGTTKMGSKSKAVSSNLMRSKKAKAISVISLIPKRLNNNFCSTFMSYDMQSLQIQISLKGNLYLAGLQAK